MLRQHLRRRVDPKATADQKDRADMKLAVPQQLALLKRAVVCGQRLLALVAVGIGLSALAADAQSREIRVGIYSNPPKLFLDSSGAPAGIFPDLLAMIGEQEGLRFTYIPCEWQQCLEMTASGKLDLMPDVALNEERLKLFDFHKTPALNSWSVIYRAPSVPVSSFLDLNRRSIAVLSQSVQQTYLQNALGGFGVDAQLLPVASFEEGFRAVQEGRADAVAVNHHYGSYAAKNFGLIETPIVFLPSSLFIVTGKGANADLLILFDYYFSQWREDPQSPLFDVLKKWTGQESLSVVPRYIWWALAGISAAVLLALGIAAYLRAEVRRQTARVREGEERLDAILNEVGSAIYVKDANLRYEYVNRVTSEVFDRAGPEILGKLDSDLFDAKLAQQLAQVDREVLETGRRYSGREVVPQGEGGPQRMFFSVKKPLFDANGAIAGLCGISTDITDQIDFQDKLDKLANFDPLTGLHNRLFFFSEAERLVERPDHPAGQSALILVNLDDFKELNDTAGHKVGDILLQQTAEQLAKIKHPDQLLARIVGDSFAIFIETLPAAKSALIAEINDLTAQILAEAARVKDLEGMPYHGKASIGVSIFDPEQVSVQVAFKQAELALYDAKNGAKGTFRIFEAEMEELAKARRKLDNELREAISGGQLLPYYQPQVDAQGRLHAMEALVRWNHPAQGLRLPATFIPLAESSGQILALGQIMRDAVCRQLGLWANDPLRSKIIIAVNVSATEFFDEGFVGSVIDSVSRHRFDPGRLELELTESQFIKNFDQALVKMSALKGIGVRLSLDDFGTGYSSLSRLKQLPFDQIKIDASFVRDVVTSPSDAAIVQTIVKLGAALGVEVLAEGVETQAQKDRLLELGCEKFQGFLDGAPMPVEQAEALFGPALATAI
jgi:diguanylate cyclase (GGDEF)-like protein/PAS domain S-box-containing protein